MRIQPAVRFVFLCCLSAILSLLAACRPTPSFTSTPTVVLRQLGVDPLAQLGKGISTDLAWSNDGNLLAVASSMGIYVYDGRTLELLKYMKTAAWEQSLAFSPDDQRLFSLSEEGIRMWNLETGDLVRILEGRGTRTTTIAASPVMDKGDFFLAAGMEGSVRLWKAGAGLLVHNLRGPESKVTGIAFSPDGTLIAAGFETGDIYLWDVQDGTRLTIAQQQLAITDLAFSPDGTRLLVALLDRQAYILHISQEHSGDLVISLAPSVGPQRSAAIHLDGDLFAIGTVDGTVAFSSMAACDAPGVCWGDVSIIKQHQSPVIALSFSPDGQMLASLSQDGEIQLWRVECLGAECTVQPTETLSGYTPPVNAVSMLPDGQTLAIGYVNGRLDLWQKADVPEGWVAVRAIEAHTGAVRKMAVSSDGRIIVSAGDDNAVRVWRLSGDTPLNTIRGHAWLITDVDLSPDDRMIASAACDKTVKLWGGESGELFGTLLHPACVRGVAFSADGEWLLTGADDGLVRVWDWASGEQVQRFEGHESAVWRVAWSPGDELIVSGDDAGGVRVWSRTGGQMVVELKGCRDRVTGLVFSPDGALVMAGSLDGAIRIWQINGGVLLYTLNQGSAVNDLALSPDGRLLIAGLSSGIVRLWQFE